MTPSDSAVRTERPEPAPAPVDPHRRRRVVVDVVVVFGVLLVLGVVGAVLWWQLVDLPKAVLSNGSVVIAPTDLTAEVGIDGWYALIALGGGLLAGVGLTAWRRTDPLVTVLAVGLAAVLAGWVMRALGRVLGPGNPAEVLRGGHSGDTAPVQLALHASGVLWLWPTAAALGSLVWLYLASGPRSDARGRGAAGSGASLAREPASDSAAGTPGSD